jgi:hypothetical protein
MGVMVITCYKPKPGKEEALLGLVRGHLPVLRGEGLVGDGPALAGRAKDGTIVEAFVWKSKEAIDAAHENPAVLAMWDRFGKVCEHRAIADLAESKEMFSPFAPIDLA